MAKNESKATVGSLTITLYTKEDRFGWEWADPDTGHKLGDHITHKRTPTLHEILHYGAVFCDQARRSIEKYMEIKNG